MSNQAQKAVDNYDRYAYARDNGHLDFVQKASMCDEYFLGNQWEAEVAERLDRLGKPIITINKVLSSCATLFGEQLMNSIDVSFRPAKDGVEETATALDKVWIHIATQNNYDWIESEMAADGFIRGRGFVDIRANFDDNLQGEARIKLLNSKNVVVDPDAEQYDPDEWNEVFVTKWFNSLNVERHYGAAAAREIVGRDMKDFSNNYDGLDWEPDSFGNQDRRFGYTEDHKRRRVYRIIERQYRDKKTELHFVNPETGDMRAIPEQWGHNRISYVAEKFGLKVMRRPVERIRWTVSLDNLLLHDDWSPYKHFTPVPYFPYFRYGKTMGIVENLLSPQDLLNKSTSQELHIVNTTANSGWITKAGGLANMTPEELEERGGEDGLVIQVHNNVKTDVEKIQPNQVPTGLDRLSFKADDHLKEVSMVSDSMRGFDREDVAAKAIHAKQAMGTVSTAKPFTNLAYTRQLVVRNIVDIVQAYYTEERVLNITGRGPGAETEQLVVNQMTPEGIVVNDLTLGEYGVVATSVPARETYEQSQFEELKDMREMGIAIPDHFIVEHSHANRKEELIQAIKQATGQADPNEQQQRMAELEMQLKEVEVLEKQADAAVKQANAQLNSVRAAKEAQEAQGGNGEAEAEMVRIAMEREKMLSELQLEREKVEQQLELEWRKFFFQQRLEREKARSQIQINEQKAESDQEIAKDKAATEQKLNKQKTDADVAAKKKMAKATPKKPAQPKK